MVLIGVDRSPTLKELRILRFLAAGCTREAKNAMRGGGDGSK